MKIAGTAAHRRVDRRVRRLSMGRDSRGARSQRGDHPESLALYTSIPDIPKDATWRPENRIGITLRFLYA